MEQKIEFRKVRDFGEIINDTFVFIKQTGKPLFKTVVTICGIAILAQVLSSVIAQLKMTEVVSSDPGRIGNMFGLAYYIGLFLSLVNYTLISLTVISFIHVYREKGNEEPTVSEVWAFVKFYLLKFMMIGILLGIIFCFGFVLCLLPGFYLIPILSLIFPIMLIESSTFGYAFDKSFKLIKGQWWTTFGVQIIMGFIIMAGSLAVLLPSMLISGASVFLQPGKMTQPIVIINSILGSIAYILMVLPTIAITFSYYSLSEQKDGLGLMERINTLGDKDGNTLGLPAEEY